MGQIKGDVAVGLRVEVVQNVPRGFVLGQEGDFQGDAAGDAAEVVQQDVCTVYHSEGTLGAVLVPKTTSSPPPLSTCGSRRCP